jgi:hypothetical protein
VLDLAKEATGAKTEAGTLCTAFAEDPDGIFIQLDELVPA